MPSFTLPTGKEESHNWSDLELLIMARALPSFMQDGQYRIHSEGKLLWLQRATNAGDLSLRERNAIVQLIVPNAVPGMRQYDPETGENVVTYWSTKHEDDEFNANWLRNHPPIQ